MLPDSDPRQLAWANARGLVLLRTTVPLIVVLLPLFHVFFGWLPAAPPDSLAVRLAGAGVGAVVFVLTYTSAWVRAHAAAAMVPVALALLVATAMVIVDSGNHPLYIAGGLISTFGIQLAFARTRDMVITFLGSSLFHTLYAHHQGSLQDADTPIILVLAWVSSFVSAVLGSMHIRAQTSEHAVTVALEEKGRQLELVNDRLQREQARSEELLRNVLPDVVASRLKDRSGVIADHHADVSVIFVDLVDFTTFANGRSPDEVVDLLNGIFTRFDRLAAQHGVEKIKTIGDAYMAAAM